MFQLYMVSFALVSYRRYSKDTEKGKKGQTFGQILVIKMSQTFDFLQIFSNNSLLFEFRSVLAIICIYICICSSLYSSSHSLTFAYCLFDTVTSL